MRPVRPRRSKAPAAPKPSETRLVHWIIAQLQLRYPDGVWERQNVVRVAAEDRFIRANTKGAADIRGTYLGRAIELEVKRPGEEQTLEQIARMNAIRGAEAVYEVVHNPTEAIAVVEAVRRAVGVDKL